MEIRLYQIDLDRDTENLCFMGQDFLARHKDAPTVIDASIYDLVYQGDLDVETPEDVFLLFHDSAPEGHIGRSMSVSDVVIMEAPDREEKAYFCDSIGFVEVAFDEYDAETPDRNITVVLLQPGKLAKVTEINSSLASLQAAVGGGLIEAVYPFEEEVAIVCNEEGKINGMPLNRALYADSSKQEMIDILAGPCFICSCKGSSFGSLNEEQQKRYKDMFKFPEQFFRVGSDIKAVPFTPEKNQER